MIQSERRTNPISPDMHVEQARPLIRADSSWLSLAGFIANYHTQLRTPNPKDIRRIANEIGSINLDNVLVRTAIPLEQVLPVVASGYNGATDLLSNTAALYHKAAQTTETLMQRFTQSGLQAAADRLTNYSTIFQGAAQGLTTAGTKPDNIGSLTVSITNPAATRRALSQLPTEILSDYERRRQAYNLDLITKSITLTSVAILNFPRGITMDEVVRSHREFHTAEGQPIDELFRQEVTVEGRGQMTLAQTLEDPKFMKRIVNSLAVISRLPAADSITSAIGLTLLSPVLLYPPKEIATSDEFIRLTRHIDGVRSLTLILFSTPNSSLDPIDPSPQRDQLRALYTQDFGRFLGRLGPLQQQWVAQGLVESLLLYPSYGSILLGNMRENEQAHDIDSLAQAAFDEFRDAHPAMNIRLVPINAVDNRYIYQHQQDLLAAFQRSITQMRVDRERIRPFIDFVERAFREDLARRSGENLTGLLEQGLGRTIFQWIGNNLSGMRALNSRILGDAKKLSPQAFILHPDRANVVELGQDSIFTTAGITNVMMEASPTPSVITTRINHRSGLMVTGLFHVDSGQFEQLTNTPLDGSVFNGQEAMTEFLAHAVTVAYSTLVREAAVNPEAVESEARPTPTVVDAVVPQEDEPDDEAQTGAPSRRRARTAPRARGNSFSGAGASETSRRTPAAHYVDGYKSQFPGYLPVREALDAIRDNPDDEDARTRLTIALGNLHKPRVFMNDARETVDRRALIFGLPSSFGGEGEMYERNPLMEAVDQPTRPNDTDGWDRFLASLIFLRNFTEAHVSPGASTPIEAWAIFRSEGTPLSEQSTNFFNAIARGLSIGPQHERTE